MTEDRDLVLTFELSHAPEKVWRALTEPALLARWLMKTNLELTVGNPFQFQMDPTEYWDGTVHCELLEIDKPRLLRYSWRALGVDTVVAWTLDATDRGTLLTLTQTGFKPDQKQAFAGARMGWNGMAGEALPKVLADIA
ncbi:MAG: SRPBCC domain-containing protein [Haliangiales bacterium]